MTNSKKDSWETQEVINWLINDEGCYDELLGKDAEEIEAYVREGMAPLGLYESLEEPPSTLDDVDWDEVAESLVDEDEDEDEDEDTEEEDEEEKEV